MIGRRVELRNLVNIAVIAFWLLMQVITIAHSYGHAPYHPGLAVSQQASEPALHATHATSSATHQHTVAAAAVISDSWSATPPADFECCDDTQCTTGDILVVQSLASTMPRHVLRVHHCAPPISWLTGALTPPPNLIS